MYNIVSMENNYCFKCGACCNKIAVDFSKRIIYRDGIQTLTKEFEAMLIPVEKREDITFCSCKFLKNQLCINPDKPQECTNYPSSPFAFLPEGCGYYGLIFAKRENFMQKIRKMEEEIIHYEALMNSCSKDEAKQYAKIIEKHKSFINKYSHFF